MYENRTGPRRRTPGAGRKHTDDGIRLNCDGGGHGDGVRWNHGHSGRDGEASMPAAVSDWQSRKTPPNPDHCTPNDVTKPRRRKERQRLRREAKLTTEVSWPADIPVKSFRWLRSGKSEKR